MTKPETGLYPGLRLLFATVTTPRNPVGLLAVVEAVRPDERATECQAVQALRLRYRHHLRHEVLVRTRCHVERNRIQLVVASRVDPTVSLHHQRIALLVQNAGENGIVRRRRRERRRGQTARVLS